MAFRIALAQINCTVGDFEGNKRKIVEEIRKAKAEGARLVVFPELAIPGYPPKDLLFKQEFLESNRAMLDDIMGETEGIAAIIGYVDFYQQDKAEHIADISSPFAQRKLVLHNTAALLQNCRMIGKVYKVHLPNYDVFDEKRYFTSGKECPLFELEGEKVGINICEDMWFDEGPTKEQVRKGAELIINISASPYYAGKREIRRQVIAAQARKHGVPILYVNMVGGQDDLIFDGSSYVFSSKGKLIARGESFAEDFLLIDALDGETLPCEDDHIANVFQALVMGTRDYARKNDFEKALIGLSGGIDSALTAVIACEALGAERVMGLLMPGPFSSEGSIDDARALARNLGMTERTLSITGIYDTYLDSLKDHFADRPLDSTEENIQARIRGNLLMAFSNKFGLLVLSTGNKSEFAVGYSTLYGDMAGGLAVISDVPKTMVYQLSRYFNELKGAAVIPETILSKPPSAELRANQKDSDDLPEYEILDAILDLHIEEGLGYNSIIQKGFDAAIVSNILERINRSEFKRKQAPVGLKITPKAFGFGRRMPVTNKFSK